MQPLLLLHGAVGSKSQFSPLAKLNENFVVHTMDFSGHGGRALPDTFSIEKFADDVLGYLSENDLPSVNIFGYSMGGYVALYLAKHHPEKVSAVFTLATKFNWTPEIAQQETTMLDAEKIELKVPAFSKQLEMLHFPTDWKSVLKKTAEMMTGLGNQNALHTEDYRAIGQKVLIGIGDKDAMVTLEETIGVYRSLPNADLIVLPHTPHPFEKVDHERLVTEMISFFKAL
jgi:pimeloyl-ACP methyl ester carboxylesterase